MSYEPVPITPGPGQESVWDYPRPPACEPTKRLIEVRKGLLLLARTTRAWRVLETSHPPNYYIDPADLTPGLLGRSAHTSTLCEWKGRASYFNVLVPGGPPIRGAAWSYLDPTADYEPIAGFVAFSPSLLDCYVDGERVRAQEGGFYGGWITDDVVGPFKGGPGTLRW